MPKRSVSKAVDSMVVAFLKRHAPQAVAEWHSRETTDKLLEALNGKKTSKSAKAASGSGHSPYIWFCITQRKEAEWVKEYNAQDVLREMGRRWQEVKKNPEQMKRYVELSEASKQAADA